jgi:hypothetical protein
MLPDDQVFEELDAPRFVQVIEKVPRPALTEPHMEIKIDVSKASGINLPALPDPTNVILRCASFAFGNLERLILKQYR